MRRHLSRALLTTGIVALVTFGLLEATLRVLLPQQELYPRYRFSERYGHVLPASATIVHQLPGSWRFVYHTNEYGFRVAMPELSNRYERPHVVVLGDSVSFGQGVNDGEEYAAVLARQLGGSIGVVNLGVPGFGLTHEIRVFYEFGLLYEPRVVVLQFCVNDPDDNLYEKVTTVERGRFRFHRENAIGGGMAELKDWLSGSVLQRSAAYNFVRYKIYLYWHGQVTGSDTPAAREHKEAFYNELLTAFAEDLRRRGIALVMFDVPGHFGWSQWPGVRSHVEALAREGRLVLLDSAAWFKGVRDYGTPEGHPFGPKGHRIVAEHLAGPLRGALNAGGHAPAVPPAEMLPVRGDR